MRRLSSGLLSLALISAFGVAPAWAHGVIGKRFFPATLTIDDPFVADELALPSVVHIKGPEGKETEIGAELAKTITPDVGISISGEYRILDSAEGGTESGFANPEIGVKYALFKSAAHEAIVSLGLEWEIGGVGDKAVGAASTSTLAPTLFFGKGLGDLPDGLGVLKPLALTGVFGAEIPLTSAESNALTYGFAIEYSLPYLQSFVKDVGIPWPLNRLIPVVEVAFETPLDGGKTTGTINPGLIWAGKFIELGLEAVLPINDATGKNVGVRALVHFFIDDIYPAVFRPIFGGGR